VSLHSIFLHLRSPEKFNLRIEKLKRDTPFPTGSIHVVPAGSPLLVSWQGSRDVVVVYLEPSVVAQVATESFQLDSTRMVVPPFYSPEAPELRSVILSLYSELRIGSGVQLLVHALANILAVHLIRHVTCAHRPPPTTETVLPRPKLRTVIEYVMENLERSLTLEQMASVAQLSPYHFARQFKATTRMTPYQYVIERRVERAQQLLRINGELSLAEVAARTGFSDQSQFTSLFKRIVGITPRQFRVSAGIS